MLIQRLDTTELIIIELLVVKNTSILRDNYIQLQA